MAFDVEKMFQFCRKCVSEFAHDHQEEAFYAFAIDADMLCLNSEERFAETLKSYQSSWRQRTRQISRFEEMTDEDWRVEAFGVSTAVEFEGLDRDDEPAVLSLINARREVIRQRGCEYQTDGGIAKLRGNTGDWAYQGFGDLDDDSGFDADLYAEHYGVAGGLEAEEVPSTEYATAMDALVTRLVGSNVFRPLVLTDDFLVEWVDHDY